MKKSKHFRKDVIMARIIAGVLLIVLIALLVFAISHFTKSSGQDKDSQNSQNTEHTQDETPGYQNTENVGVEDTQEQTTEENTEPSVDEKVYVKTTTTLNLRVEPNTSCATLTRIPEGTKIEVLEDLERWYKVIYNGQEGYVSKTYVVVVEE